MTKPTHTICTSNHQCRFYNINCSFIHPKWSKSLASTTVTKCNYGKKRKTTYYWQLTFRENSSSCDPRTFNNLDLQLACGVCETYSQTLVTCVCVCVRVPTFGHFKQHIRDLVTTSLTPQSSGSQKQRASFPQTHTHMLHIPPELIIAPARALPSLISVLSHFTTFHPSVLPPISPFIKPSCSHSSLRLCMFQICL